MKRMVCLILAVMMMLLGTGTGISLHSDNFDFDEKVLETVGADRAAGAWAEAAGPTSPRTPSSRP